LSFIFSYPYRNTASVSGKQFTTTCKAVSACGVPSQTTERSKQQREKRSRQAEGEPEEKSLEEGGHTVFRQVVPRAQKKKTNALQVPLPRRLSWPCVSDLQSIYKAESWQRAVTLDDSQTPTSVLHNTSVVI
jgi:hypothetical protein